VLINIKIIKLQAWDEKFWKKLEDLRSVEKSWVSIFMYITGWNVSSLWLASTAASIATFILYISLNGQLIEPGKVFTAVATFSILQEANLCVSRGSHGFGVSSEIEKIHAE
jgi:hypothetical protein